MENVKCVKCGGETVEIEDRGIGGGASKGEYPSIQAHPYKCTNKECTEFEKLFYSGQEE